MAPLFFPGYDSFEALFRACRFTGFGQTAEQAFKVIPCDICYNGRTEVSMRLPCCQKVAGAVCLREWLTSNSSLGKCPFCRHTVIRQEGYVNQKGVNLPGRGYISFSELG